MSKEKFKTEHGVFDEFTSQTLFKLSTEGLFHYLVSPISIGKESNVFAGQTREGTFVAIKIYRLENCDFNRMYDYIKFDPRFTGLLKRRRKVIFAWAKREYRNLLLAREAGVSCPTPLSFKNNVLVEEFIGDTSAAPRLINAKPKNPSLFFKKIIKDITLMYQNNLTHGDLSAYNILNYKEKPILIDFSQATLSKSQRFEELFERDVRIVCTYFQQLGIDADYEKVINSIRQRAS